MNILAGAVHDQDSNDPPDTMVADYSVGFTVVDYCTQPFTPIHDLQGSGAATPNPDTTVTTMGVVVGDYEIPLTGSGQIRGYFIQSAAAVADANPATSDGIFVYNPGRNNVSLGDLVRVTGVVSEYNGQTQISSPAGGTLACGTGSITPTDITFPLASVDALEAYEGMLVRIPQTLVVSEHYLLGRFGQVTLSLESRLSQPTNVVAPGAPALALQAENNLRKILLDDGDNLQNVDPIVFGRGGLPLSASNTLRGGDTAAGIIGVLNYTWGGNSASPNAYRIRPVNALGGFVNFAPTNERPASAPDVGGTVKVVGMNVLNYFNTWDGVPDNADNCTMGVGGDPTDCRGADTEEEFNRQWPKTVQAILEMDADVIGLTEIENDGYDSSSAIAMLVDQINTTAGPGTYAYIDADTATGQVNALGEDAIKVGMIYKPGTVTPVGDTAVLNTDAFVNGGDSGIRNRPTLAQAFKVNTSGALFIVDVNHLKSKGSACDLPDQGDGQGNCNQVRVNAATELVNWLASDPTGIGDPDILLVGDYNAYAMEDPITTIKTAGYTNLIESHLGTYAYSYVFDGQWGYLDHALGSASIVGQVTGLGTYHINSDEPSVLDYNTNFKTPGQIVSLYAPDEYRISDHDPVLIGLDLSPAPNVDAGGPYAVDEGEPIVLTAEGSDAEVDSLVYAWDLDNNGTFETTGKSVFFVGVDGPAVRTVTVQVTDAGGLTATDTATVTVSNVAPTLATPVVVREPSVVGGTVVVSASFVDPGRSYDAPYDCKVNYGDGSGELAGIVDGTTCSGPSHVYKLPGIFTVTVKLSDKDGAMDTRTVSHGVKAKPPVTLWPSKTTTWANPKFVWTTIPGQTKFEIRVYNKSTGKLVRDMIVGKPNCTTNTETNVATCRFTPFTSLALVNNTQYEWQVRSYKGIWSNYSAKKAFTKLAPPVAQTPVGAINQINPKFTWTKIPDATKYMIELRKSTDVLVGTIEITKMTCTTTTCYYTVYPPLSLFSGGYKWRVRAFNGYYGPYSAYKAFTVR